MPSSGAVIKRADVARARQARAIANADADAATERARQINAQAISAARQLRAAGYQHGLQHGIDAALQPVAALLTDLARIEASLVERLKLANRTALDALCRHDDCLTALLDSVTSAYLQHAERQQHGGRLLALTLPAALDAPTRLLSAAAAAGYTVTVHNDAQQRFAIRIGQHLWAADPAALADAIELDCTAPDALADAHAAQPYRTRLAQALRAAACQVESGDAPTD